MFLSSDTSHIVRIYIYIYICECVSKLCTVPKIYCSIGFLVDEVSLLRSFTDISESPLDWTPGVHGNWANVEKTGRSKNHWEI